MSINRMRPLRAGVSRTCRLLFAVAALAPAAVPAQQPVVQAGESAAARQLESIRDDTPTLYAFLRAMPKGGDLHNHLLGTVYPESFIRWAAEDGACVVLSTYELLPAPCRVSGDTVRASDALGDTDLYSALIDAFSTRNWHPAWEESGHSRFFSTFPRFAALPGRDGDMIAEAMIRAADGLVSYLELMHNVLMDEVFALADAVGWVDDLDALHRALMDAGMQRTVQAMRAEFDRIEARRDSLLGCRTANPQPACDVTVRYQAYALRAMPPERVFAQLLAGFLLTRADPRTVGVNIVQPEDWFVPMRDYSLHMRMFAHLNTLYPGVPLALHAGELTAGSVPPEGLRSHVREAVTIAGAHRIGHGISVMFENDPHGLLAEMARRGVLVEVNLTSARTILRVEGRQHPLRAYMDAGVPYAISTDDEGVSRSEMTMEYLRAAQDQRLGYAELKRSARNSLHHAFVDGEPLWADARTFRPVPECAEAAGGMAGSRCDAFATRNSKARLQRELELGFQRFEAGFR
jgi:adenosine deaminase